MNEKAAYDTRGKCIKRFTRRRASTKQNFIDTVRSRKVDRLTTDVLEGHLSCGLVHMANTSYRVGRTVPAGEVMEAVRGRRDLARVWERMHAHLDANGIDLDSTPLTLGCTLTMDPEKERYTGAFSSKANHYLMRSYRPPFEIPDDL